MQFRKVIHVSGVLIPAAAILIGKPLVLSFIFLGLVVYLIIESLKPKISPAVLYLVYRENEIKGLALAPLSYIISVISLLSLSFFVDEKLCFAAIAILAAGDGMAGVIGRRYGRHRLPFNRDKSWEGSLSGFAAASITGFFYAGQIAMIGSVFGMMAGAVSEQDNVTVPYGGLVAMFIARWMTVLV